MGTIAHYKPLQSLCEYLLELDNDNEFQSLSFSYERTEKIFISMNDNNSTIDLYPMNVLSSDPDPNFEFPYDINLNSIEIYQLDIIDENNNNDTFLEKIYDISASLNVNSK